MRPVNRLPAVLPEASGEVFPLLIGELNRISLISLASGFFTIILCDLDPKGEKDYFNEPSYNVQKSNI